MKIILTVLIGCMLTTMTINAAPTNEPAAASLAFTSKDPAVLQAMKLVKSGNFKDAENLLAASTSQDSPDSLRARTETVETIRRIRYDYSLTAEGLLAKIKETIPDATLDEAQRWAEESRARWRMIDGQKFFFRREPQNIFLFSEEAKERRKKIGKAPKKSDQKLIEHLKAVIDEAERTGRVEVQPVHHKVTHTLIIPGDTPGIKLSSLVRVWLPFPQEYRQQQSVKLISASPEPTLIAPSAVDGNPVTGGAQRTVYFEQRVTDPSKPLQFEITFDYLSYAYYPKLDEAKVQPLPADWNNACLTERPPHIVFTPEIRAQVAGIIGSETNALAKARKIFHWVSANVIWNAEDEYGTIPSLAIKGFTARRGDCGVQNTVFITMCRIAGVPARWQSGFETKPGANWGMHDWSEIYITPWGWLPTDASYGVKKSDDPRTEDFYCGHQDAYRMIVNLDWGRELFPPKQSLRSEPADFQRGEVEVDGKNLYFNQWEYKTEAERNPVSKVE